MKNIIENNKLIAEFMGYPKHKIDFVGKRLNFENSKHNTYHKDWNDLMEVVKKIEVIGKTELKFSIHFENVKLSSDIQVVYNACLEFIKWYNQQNKNK